MLQTTYCLSNAAGDFTALTQTLTLPPGGDQQLQTFTVQIIDDSIAEGMESFSVELGVRSGDTEVVLGEISTATVMIVDNDGMNNFYNFQLHSMNIRYLYLCRHCHWLHSSSAACK